MDFSRFKREGDLKARGPVLDDCFALDVRVWAREGKLIPRTAFRVDWPEHGAFLGVSVDAEGVVLLFKRLGDGYEALPIAEERFRVIRTPTPFGGTHTRFICPDCERRVWKLFAHEVTFRCQRCLGLRRLSGLVSARERKAMRLEKIDARLRIVPGMPAAFVSRKPEGMSLQAFRKLRDEKAALEAEGVKVRPGSGLTPSPNILDVMERLKRAQSAH
ncbi:hypothetical protein JDN40_03935 [Rhodomicrobium vannielii ATCC 17100]|uniref:hypothetical protein n=1 Tax=Rhodomicrobium vannielii TaxID=1069 RepID=UPI00191A16D4|nr:hypothetical protein [Rhodomicrobium vannielii]MBJ7533256.1 hypothetical protein [Rhodomicrobium vannielii ATCC 17100]